MKESAFTFVLLAALVLGISFAIRAEDNPETPYDESELLPYEASSPLLKIVMRQTAASQTVPKTDLVGFLHRSATRDGTRAEQSEPTRQHASKSITVLNCLRRC